VERYLDILEQTFLVRRLLPYFRNIGKRLTKSPKLYIRDTGLLHHLLNISTQEELDSHPVRGASWETLVIEDLIRRERLRHQHAQFFFWRTSTGSEVDLVIDRGSELLAIEVKTGRGSHPETLRNLDQARFDLGAKRAWIVDQGEGSERLRREIERRSMASCVSWLPP
jgi:predicted AAA+ superfamily ATPase